MKYKILGLLVCSSVLAGTNALAGLSDGLVAHYSFDDNVNDSTANGHHGTAFGGLGYSTGVHGNALDLDGVDDYVSVADATELRMQDNFSVSIWFKTEFVGVTDHWALVEKYGDSNGINYRMGQFVGADAYLQCQFENSSDSDWYLKMTQSNTMQSNKWHHAAFTKDGDSCVLYLDGEVMDSRTFLFTEVTGAYDLLIGVFESDWAHPTKNGFFNGQLDELRIYNRGLSSNEVVTLSIIDTDGDGLSDEDEVNIYGTNAGLWDTDGDGLSDGQEILTYGTNALLKDSDDDGFNDDFEIRTGFDPALDTSTPDLLSEIQTAIEFKFNAANEVSYRIEATESLSDSWEIIETDIIGLGDVVKRLYSIEEQSKRFFRARRN